MDLSRFEALFEQAPLSMQLLAADGRTLRVNKAWEALWATDDGELTRWVLAEYNVLADPQLERSGVAAGLRRAFAGETVELPTIRYDPAETGKPGNPRWVRGFAHPIKDAEGRVREVMLMHEDVSQRMAADAAVRAAEERLRIAVLAGNIGIWEWDVPGDTLTWSPEVFALFGRAPGAGPRRAADFAALVHPDERAGIAKAVEEAVAKRIGFAREYRALLPDGDTRWLSTWSTMILDDKGAPARMVGAIISIDAYKKAEGALRDGDRRKDEFLAMLSHELRNPLAPIRTAAEVLRMASTDPLRVDAATRIIDRQVRHITKLMDDLLDVSRVTRGLVTLEREVIDLGSVVHTAVEQVTPILQSKGHSLTTNVDAGGALVMGDRARLVQVVANLLNNAARYTPDGGHIDIALQHAANRVTVRITDNGSGIEPAFLPHVFELFAQGERSPDRSQGGLGLGLALVKRLVELHGGEASAASAGPGLGSTFSVSLPAAAADTQRAPGGQHGPQAATGLEAPMRITVVDDNRDAADALFELLTAMGHEVDVHYAADSLLSSQDLHRSDAFVIDIGLPGMDGRALAQALRRRGVEAPLVALTGYGQPADRELSMRSGFDHHLVKPIEWTDLSAVLRDRAGSVGQVLQRAVTPGSSSAS